MSTYTHTFNLCVLSETSWPKDISRLCNYRLLFCATPTLKLRLGLSSLLSWATQRPGWAPSRLFPTSPAMDGKSTYGVLRLFGYLYSILWVEQLLWRRDISATFQLFLEHFMINIISVQFSHSVMSDSLWPHGLQHARPPCPSPTLRACSNLCQLSQWCPPTISSSVVPFSCPQSFPASGSFPMSQLFASVCQIIRVSASASVLPMNIQCDFL